MIPQPSIKTHAPEILSCNSSYAHRKIYEDLSSAGREQFSSVLDELKNLTLDLQALSMQCSRNYGAYFIKMKELLKKELGHGFFEKWFWEWRNLTAFPYSLRTAEKWMAIASIVQDDQDDLATLPQNILAEIGSAKLETKTILLDAVKQGRVKSLRDVREIKQFGIRNSEFVIKEPEAPCEAAADEQLSSSSLLPTNVFRLATSEVKDLLVARHAEIRDAALKAASAEIASHREARNAIATKNAILEQQLAELMPQINTLVIEKTKLEQRVKELEFALHSASTNSWDISGVRADKKQILTPFLISNTSGQTKLGKVGQPCIGLSVSSVE